MGKSLYIISLTIFLSASALGATTPYHPLKPAWEYYIGAGDFFLLDLDQDGTNELYLVIYGDTATYVNAYNSTGSLLWNTWLKGLSVVACTGGLSETVHMVYLDDLDKDKDLDIYVSTKVRGEKVNINLFSYVERELDPYFRNHKLKVRWETKEVEGIATDISTADVYGTPGKEVLVSTTDSVIYALDSSGSIVTRYDVDGRVYDVYASDIDGDGQTELVAGTYQSVYYIDGGIKWSFPLYKAALNVHAASGLVFSSDGENLQAFTLTGEPRWRNTIGGITGIASGDIDNDSAEELIVSSGSDIKAYTSNGSFKWSYPLSENIVSIKLLSENKLVAATRNSVYILETDNRYIKNKTAYGLYLKANESYHLDNCIAAKQPAEEALALFREIGNIEWALASDIIVAQCTRDEDSKDLADGYYALALESFRNKEFDNARAYAGKALEVYAEIRYYYGVTLSDDLLTQVNEAEYSYKAGEADKIYAEAYWLYTNNELKDASQELEKAKSLYAEINHSKGLEDCASLYKAIEDKGRKAQADESFELAKAKYASGEYEDAAPLFSQAYDIYVYLNLTSDIEKAAPYKNMSQCYVTANQYYALAQDLFSKSDYDNATYYALQAKSVYEGIPDYRKSVEAESLALEIENKKNETEMMGYAKIAGAAAIVVVIVGGVFSFLRKRRK